MYCCVVTHAQVDDDASYMEIKAAYRALAKQCHPDIMGQAGHALSVLLNEVSKSFTESCMLADLQGSWNPIRHNASALLSLLLAIGRDCPCLIRKHADADSPARSIGTATSACT